MSDAPAGGNGTAIPTLGSSTPPTLGDGCSVLEAFMGEPLRAWAPGGVSPFALLHVVEGHPVVHEGAPSRHIYLVQAGEFKIVRTAEDGYEHVLDFVGRGDVLGLDGLSGGTYAQGAVALEDAWVYALPTADLPALWQRLPRFAMQLQAAGARQIARAGELAWLMAAVGADRRTARFVLHWSRRMAERGQSPRRLLLRMGRRDIASHLGLAHESVSRSLTVLAERGLLRVDNREIEIVDDAGLRHFAMCTRGSHDGVQARASARQALPGGGKPRDPTGMHGAPSPDAAHGSHGHPLPGARSLAPGLGHALARAHIPRH